MIGVSNSLHVYEFEGKETIVGNSHIFVIRSHWNNNDRVVIEIGEENGQIKSFTLLAKDLVAAIKNAENTAKW